MKRHNNLYRCIAQWDNLLRAFYKAAKGKRRKQAVQNYEEALYFNLKQLQMHILNQTVHTGAYRFFKIYDPKERTICAAPFSARVLHHAVMNVCEDIFDSFQIYDSYACRKNKGTKKAVYRAFHFAKSYSYCLKLDMKKYFDSISHQKLLGLLKRKFKDKKLLALFEKIICSYSVTDGYGIPIGNLTSQYFANYYLGFFDRYAKEVLKITGYIRYMDDILIFAESSKECKALLKKIQLFLDQTLYLALKPVIVCQTKNGIPFLGFLITKRHIQLLKKQKLRIRKKIAEYTRNLSTGFWSEAECSRHALPVLARREWAV